MCDYMFFQLRCPVTSHVLLCRLHYLIKRIFAVTIAGVVISVAANLWSYDYFNLYNDGAVVVFPDFLLLRFPLIVESLICHRYYLTAKYSFRIMFESVRA